jgi:hypothetical protein
LVKCRVDIYIYIIYIITDDERTYNHHIIIINLLGKFQLIVFNHSGHHIQEDVPDHLAQALVEFQHRNQALNLPIKRFPIPVTKNSTSNNTEKK